MKRYSGIVTWLLFKFVLVDSSSRPSCLDGISNSHFEQVCKLIIQVIKYLLYNLQSEISKEKFNTNIVNI